MCASGGLGSVRARSETVETVHLCIVIDVLSKRTPTGIPMSWGPVEGVRVSRTRLYTCLPHISTFRPKPIQPKTDRDCCTVSQRTVDCLY